MIRYIAGLCMLLSASANAAHLLSPAAGLDLTTNKTVTIIGEIDQGMAANVQVQLKMNKNLPGPLLVVIYSPGGSVEAGKVIIESLLATHEKLVCVVIGAAHSMAFDILSRCDVRLATPDSTMVVHKVAMGGIPENERLTSRNLKELSEQIAKIDEPLDEVNRKLMHLSKSDYDKYADKETQWTAKELLRMGYLHGLAILD